MNHLPFSQACENNKAPILAVLRQHFTGVTRVLEVGSGTGQHAVYFAQHLPHLVWQPCDLPENHPAINAWRDAQPTANCLPPCALDLRAPIPPPGHFDALFSANTAHIVAWPLVETLLSLAAQLLPTGGLLALYGPFNYGGRYTSDSNRAFDQMLRQRDPQSGIRDFEQIEACALSQGLSLVQDHAMPANNRLLVLRNSLDAMGC